MVVPKVLFACLEDMSYYSSLYNTNLSPIKKVQGLGIINEEIEKMKF